MKWLHYNLPVFWLLMESRRFPESAYPIQKSVYVSYPRFPIPWLPPSYHKLLIKVYLFLNTFQSRPVHFSENSLQIIFESSITSVRVQCLCYFISNVFPRISKINLNNVCFIFCYFFLLFIPSFTDVQTYIVQNSSNNFQ